jgi:acyl-coenzyme A synthetase/AMP-(fatty) acid ligase
VVSPLVEAFGLTGAVIPIGESGRVGGWPSFQELIANAPTTEPVADVHGDDIWQILPTSGTTSMPKCVMQSHASAYLSAYGFALTHSRGLRCGTDLRLCTLLPVIYHAADQVHVFPAFLCGGTAIIGRRAGAADVAQVLSDEQVTALFVGSSEFLRLVVEEVVSRPGNYTLTSLTSILFTWAALNAQTEQHIRRLCGEQLQLVEILGQTESLASTRFWPDRSTGSRFESGTQTNCVGLPSPLLAAKLVDEQGAVVARSEPGKSGELVYRSPAISAGYYLDETATRDAFRDGWFHSGDCCAYDAHGELVLIDRFKDVVKSGGENVSTLRVEAVLRGHPDVVAAAVVGLPHARWSEAVTGFVVLREGANAGEDTLVAHCRERLAGYETPKRIVPVAALPVSVGTKVRKHVLREQYAALYAKLNPRDGGR